jgi:predicted flap endonuclease-1-like 5' DNA nuclease
MSYLITQIFVLLLIAGLFGLILGWYLTRISTTDAKNALLANLRSKEANARELRAELDALATAKGNCDTERRLLSDELATLRARQEAAIVVADNEALAALRAELEECRGKLTAAAASGPGGEVPAMAQGHQEVEDAAADDLQEIKGIGPKIAAKLEKLGIRQFGQIAAWTAEDIERVNQQLRFKGRIERENWIPQARALLTARQD